MELAELSPLEARGQAWEGLVLADIGDGQGLSVGCPQSLEQDSHAASGKCTSYKGDRTGAGWPQLPTW